MTEGTSPSTSPAPARRGRGTGSRARLGARDLMAVAIFAVIYIVVVFAVAMIGIVSPLVMLISMPLAPIAAGIPYMLFLARVGRPGPVTLFGLVVGLAFLVTGQPWISLVAAVVAAALADLVLWSRDRGSRWAAIWAYTVFSVWLISPMVPMLTDREAFLNSPGVQAMGPGYVAAYDQSVTVAALLVLFAAMIVCGFLGGLLGTAVLRRHFVAAGLA